MRYALGMEQAQPLEIFLVSTPGLERPLLQETVAAGFRDARQVAGGVQCVGAWPEVWRANLVLRGATRVLARIGQFRVLHLAQLDKRARKFPWHEVLRADVPFRVEAACKKSRIYHSDAAAERIATAIREELGAPQSEDADVCVKARIDHDLCTLSIDTSGGSLHKRGHKEAVGKAPMRETMASLLLRACGFDGREPVVDPFCGSGTFVIEAAEMALGLVPGRSRQFAFMSLATFDAASWQAMLQPAQAGDTALRFHGFDRDAGAIRMATANAARAGVAAVTQFRQQPISALVAPEGPPGLVIANPPYGGRIGEGKALFALYGALGQALAKSFSGWRVGIVTTDQGLARATGLQLKPPGPRISHGGIDVKLYQAGPLP